MRILHSYLAALTVAELLLGSWNGYLALWKETEPEPQKVFPIPVSSLPTEDQKLLEQRIPIGTAEELSQALEDYLS